MPKKLNILPIYSTKASKQLCSLLQWHSTVSLLHINFLGLSFTKSFKWKFHISSFAKTGFMTFGVLCRLRQFFSPYQLLTLYRGLIRPCMGYPSQVWGSSTHTARLNRVKSKIFRFINSPHVTSMSSISQTPPQFCFSIFYRYFRGYCYSELDNCMPVPLPGASRHITFYFLSSLFYALP